METPSPRLRELARQWLAHEAASQTASDPPGRAALRLFETLRVSLTRLAGADGFARLQRRALVLASAEVPTLLSVSLTADGRLDGFAVVAPDAAVALAAHLLGLLVEFIGEPLTLRLVREAWPQAPLDQSS